MKSRIDVSRLEAAIELLEGISGAAQLLALKNLIINNNGRWDLPSAAKRPDGKPVYDPALVSVELFGVYAMSDEADELPTNWLRAARNILDAFDQATPPEAAA